MANQYDIVRAAVAVDGLGGRYVWGAKGPKNFDCSGFTWEVGRRCGSSLVQGAQNQRDQLRRAGLLIPVEQGIRTPGALLFRIDERPSNDHVAVSVGNGSTVEAHSAASGIGVFSALGRRWTHSARYPLIAYGGPPPITAPPPATGGGIDWTALIAAIREAKRHVYRAGDRHANIKFIQVKINDLSGRGLAVDGDFGLRTHQAVVDLQRWCGLTVDGVVGPQTWNLLYPNV